MKKLSYHIEDKMLLARVVIPIFVIGFLIFMCQWGRTFWQIRLIQELVE